MNLPLGNQIDAIQTRITSLIEEAAQSPDQTEEVIQVVFQQLSSLFEELQVAEEELRVQNEELRRAHQEIDQERQRYVNLFEFAPDGYLITDRNGIIREVNLSAARLFHIDQMEILGKPLSGFLLKEDYQSYLDWLVNLQSSSEIQERMLRIQPWNTNTWFDASIRVIAFQDSNQEVSGLRWQIRDVSPQVALQQALEEKNAENQRQSALLSAIFEADPGCIAVLVGPELKFAYCNPAYRYIIPNPAMVLEGQPYDRVWPQRSPYNNRSHFLEVLSTGKPYQIESNEFQFPDGTQRIFTLQARRIDWNNQPAVLLILWDTTQVKRAEITVSEMNKRMADTLESLTDAFVAWDNQWRYTYVNAAAERLLGSKREELLGRSVGQLFSAEASSWFTQNCKQAMVDQKPVSFEEYFATLNTWFDVRAYPSPDGLAVYLRDITESKLSQQKIQELNQLIELSFEPIFSWDLNGGVITWNHGCEQLYGYSAEEAVGKVSHDLLKTIHPLPLASFKELLLSQGSWKGELHHTTRDGREVVIESRQQLIEASGRQIVLETNRDITTQKQTEVEAKESQQLLSALMEYVPEGITIANAPDATISMVSRYGQQLLGGEHANKTATQVATEWRVYDPDGMKPLPDEELPLQRALKKGEIIKNQDLIQVNSRGEQLYLSCNAGPIRNETGKITGAVVAWREISDRIHAQQAIRDSEERFRSVLENSLDVAYRRNIQLDCYDYMSPAVEQVLGFTREQMNTMSFADVVGRIHPEDRPFIQAEMEKADVLGKGKLVYRFLNKQGEYRWIADNITVTKDLDGVPEFRTGILRDISDQKEREEELNQLNRTLKALSSSSQAMLFPINETEYLNEVCRIVREDCGHAMVWIGYAEDDGACSVRPVAFSGFEDGYLDTLNVTWADTERGRGPTGSAIRTGEVKMCRNMLTDPAFKPWRKEALRRGYASSIALPLISDGKAFGALTIYSRQPDPFSPEEVNLLTELTNDLANGITSLRLREARAESESRYRSLFDGMTEGFALHEIIYSEQGIPVDYRFLEANPAFEQITGLKRDQIIGKTVREALPDIETDWINIYGRVAQTGEPVNFQSYAAPLGKHFDVIAYRPKIGQFAALFIDITDQLTVEAEARRLAADVEIKRSLIEQREQERLTIARDLHDGPVQELLGAAFALESITYNLDPNSELKRELDQVRQTINQQVADLRTYAGELRPPALAKFGLAKGIASHLEGFREKHPELKIKFIEDPQEGDLVPDNQRVALFRIYQEALTNIIKHAHANHVVIHLRKQNDNVLLEIEDNGRGFRVPNDWLEFIRQGHLGLAGMHERTEAAGGTLEVQSDPGKGTLVSIKIPILSTKSE